MLRRHQPHVRVDVDRGFVVGEVEVRLVSSSLRPLGAPLPFCRPITRSCSSRVVRSQFSMRIGCAG